jgi:hypothetical protein
MTSSARRDPVRELALLVRAPEPGSSNLGGFLADNASALAQVLGIPEHKLEEARILDDEELAPRVRQLFDRARSRYVQQDLERRRQRSLEAAQRLGATARWTELGAELDVDLLLGELLADKTKKWVSFADTGGIATIIPRHLVAAAVPLRRIHMDVASYVNATTLAFRWRAGRGGYSWRPHRVDPRFHDQVLVVPLAPRVVIQLPERRRGGAWLGQILKEMGSDAHASRLGQP